ncbi:MAG: pyridoxal-phosphate dependent enzyme [Clostridiales bacterium]|jgi:threonine synthase|nr:pyridoxal-phosphate dependent enzyme [Clostridiales bacterium]
MHFKCVKCGREYEYGERIWHCSCGGYIKLIQEVLFSKNDINFNLPGMWRYEKAYPLKYNKLKASFNEGFTPLVGIEWGNMKISIKMDTLMPSGSFKDRGMVMAVNYLNNFGADKITEDSSGNAAASVAAYCALGGIPCEVFVPSGNSSSKITQAKAYGAVVNEVTGSREDVANAAQVFTQSYAGHNWHPMFAAGLRSVAYEIWEQNGFKAPKAVITPCGGGSLTLGLIDGFRELLKNGEILDMPRIIAVQPENCNPIARMFNNDTSEFTPKPTLAEGTSIAKPVKAEEIIEGIKFSRGAMVSVTEAELKPALLKANAKGIYVEPTSAIAFAALDKLMSGNCFDEHDEVVVIASGNGLKAGDTIKLIMDRE